MHAHHPTKDRAPLRVAPARLADLPAVAEVYEGARRLQRQREAIVWPSFPTDVLVREIEAGHVYRVLDGETLAGVFILAYDDEPIWGARERGAHVYLHRLARNDAWPGKGYLATVIGWAREHARALGRAGLRMDTWASSDSLISLYGRHGFRLVHRVQMGADPRLSPHYHGIELALLEDDAVLDGDAPSPARG